MDAAAQTVALSYYAGGATIHHKIVRRAGGDFTLDGKRDQDGWRSLGQVLDAVTSRARERKRFAAAMRPVEPPGGGGVRTIDLLLDAATGRAALHDYVEPDQTAAASDGDYALATDVGRATATYEDVGAGAGPAAAARPRTGIQRAGRAGSVFEGFGGGQDGAGGGTDA